MCWLPEHLLQSLVQLMEQDPVTGRRQLTKFERIWSDTPLAVQARRALEGESVDTTEVAADDPQGSGVADFLSGQ